MQFQDAEGRQSLEQSFGLRPLSGRFAARRVRTAPSHRRDWLGPEEWLLVQDADHAGNRRFWLISLPADTPLADLVRHAKGRWRVEQDYREFKREVGLSGSATSKGGSGAA